MLAASLSIDSDRVGPTGKDLAFRRDLAVVKAKGKNKSLRAAHSRDRHKGKMLASLLHAGSLERIWQFCYEAALASSFCIARNRGEDTEK